MPTGATGYLNWGVESTFKTAVAGNKCFGVGAKIASLDRKNNIKKIFGLGSQDAAYLVEGIYEGSMSLDFALANPWFLKPVMGSNSVAGAGPYTHTFTRANSPASITVLNGVDMTTDAVMTYSGCVVGDCRISGETDRMIMVNLGIMYAKEAKATAGIGSQVAETEVPFNFGHASFKINTTAVAAVDRFEMRIKRNPKLIWGLGSREAGNYAHGVCEYEASMTWFYTDAATFLEKFYGSATGPTTVSTELTSPTFEIDNGGAGVNQRKYTFTLTGCKVVSIGEPQAVEEGIMQNVELNWKSMSIDVINNTATMP